MTPVPPPADETRDRLSDATERLARNFAAVAYSFAGLGPYQSWDDLPEIYRNDWRDRAKREVADLLASLGSSAPHPDDVEVDYDAHLRKAGNVPRWSSAPQEDRLAVAREIDAATADWCAMRAVDGPTDREAGMIRAGDRLAALLPWVFRHAGASSTAPQEDRELVEQVWRCAIGECTHREGSECRAARKAVESRFASLRAELAELKARKP